MNKPLPIAVLISGGGTTLRNLMAKIREGTLSAEIRLVVSSNPTAQGLRFAQEAGIKTLVVEKKKELSAEVYSEATFGPCRAAGAEVVVMGGFLKHVLIPPDFENRVVNIHPGLIPAFCGKGMFGRHVHEAVLAAGVPTSGCTVHFVDNIYDHGPVILQRTVPILPGDTPETLAARVFDAECIALPETLNLIAEAKVSVHNGVVKLP
jgi:formyltetrahydrofolate-dependent phosphoribosylglycinamide formyltransferase